MFQKNVIHRNHVLWVAALEGLGTCFHPNRNHRAETITLTTLPDHYQTTIREYEVLLGWPLGKTGASESHHPFIITTGVRRGDTGSANPPSVLVDQTRIWRWNYTRACRYNQAKRLSGVGGLPLGVQRGLNYGNLQRSKRPGVVKPTTPSLVAPFYMTRQHACKLVRLWLKRCIWV